MKRAVHHLNNHRRTVFISAAVSLLAAYLMASRAIDTGSLQQYGLTFLLAGFGIRQLVRAARLVKA